MDRIIAAACRAAKLASLPDCQTEPERWLTIAAYVTLAGLVLVLLEWIVPRRTLRALGQVVLIAGVAGAFVLHTNAAPAPPATDGQAQTNDALQKIAITQLMDENLALQASLEREKLRRQGRALLKDQFEAIQTVKGKLPAATVIAPNTPEAMDFANDIILALIAAGVDVRMRPWPPGFPSAGTTIWSAKTDDPVMNAFASARLAPAWKNLATLSVAAIPRDVPLIAIGNRPLEP